jgi:nucleoside-diphosphate-sugar epimerase
VAAELLAAHRDGRVRVTIGRASDYYGPHGANSNAGETVFGRIVAGKRPLWTGRLDQLHSFHFLADLGRGLITLAERGEADGEVWHLPSAPPQTAQQSFDLIFEAAGRPTPARAAGDHLPVPRAVRRGFLEVRAGVRLVRRDAPSRSDRTTVEWFRSRGS